VTRLAGFLGRESLVPALLYQRQVSSLTPARYEVQAIDGFSLDGCAIAM
jgi:hypothetical protein